MQPVLPFSNIVLVTLDCVRPDFLGCYGCQSVTTKTIDRLARHGIVCEQAISQAPNTWVSHAGILTGLYPPGHALRGPYDRMDPSIPTLASVLSQHGYATAGFPGNDLVWSKAGFHKGFDLFFEHYQDCGAELASVNGITANYRNTWDDVMEACREWLQRAEQPFFLWLHYFDTHHLPYCDMPDFYRFGSQDQWQFYEGKISYADQRCVGSLVDLLIETGSYEKTLIVVAADHGEELRPGATPAHNGALSDAVLRVPLIVFAEGLPWKGVRISAQVRTIDLVPTILSLVLGGKAFGRRGSEPTFSGCPLPLPGWDTSVTKHQGRYRHVAYAENEPLGISCIRTDAWKLVVGPRGEALYHLPSDPEEVKNVVSRYPSTAAYLAHELEQLLATLPAGTRTPGTRDGEETRKLLRALGYIE